MVHFCDRNLINNCKLFFSSKNKQIIIIGINIIIDNHSLGTKKAGEQMEALHEQQISAMNSLLIEQVSDL